jgi:hypothetical protein
MVSLGSSILHHFVEAVAIHCVYFRLQSLGFLWLYGYGMIGSKLFWMDSSKRIIDQHTFYSNKMAL